jgi:hypothetical protein
VRTNDEGAIGGFVLVGHFLTRSQVARRVEIRGDEVVERPDLLRIGGTWLEEVYFAIQFDATRVIQSLGIAVAHLRRAYDDESIADWLVRPHAALSSATPLAWLTAGGSGDQVTVASEIAGPLRWP